MRCPTCGSQRLAKSGFSWRSKTELVQQWRCYDCRSRTTRPDPDPPEPPPHEADIRLTDCIFCRIAAGAVPTEFLYQDEEVMAFRDIHPQAPQHILVVPRKHIPALTNLKPQHRELVGKLVEVANGLARSQGIADKGYRLVVNCGPDGGQGVLHLHFHLLGGRRLGVRLG